MHALFLCGTVACVQLAMAAEFPPLNPFQVVSSWPAVHANNYRQDSTRLRGPEPEDSISVHTLPLPAGTTSPWLLNSAASADGGRVFWGSNATEVFTFRSTASGLEQLATAVIDTDPSDYSWTIAFWSASQVVTQDNGALLLYGQDRPGDSLSTISLQRRFDIPASQGTGVGKVCIAYDGSLVYATHGNVIGVLDREWNQLATYTIPLDSTHEKTVHNDYAMDEQGSIYFVTSQKLFSVAWTGSTLLPRWSVPLDLGGTVNQPSGTTPTLMGVGPDEDHLVLIRDSNDPARMIACWRDGIPADWAGLPGYDRRVAGIATLPGCRPRSALYAAVENSPACWGYGIACAQYAGLTGQRAPAPKGVYRLGWDQRLRTLGNTWTRSDLTMNGVLTCSAGSNLVYGSGIEDDGDFYYYGLDWDTGETRLRVPLGRTRLFDDPGNANVIAEDRSITYCSLDGLVQVRPAITRPEVERVRAGFGRVRSGADWDPRADWNGDARVDALDMAIVLRLLATRL